jgi:hypothetical protein
LRQASIVSRGVDEPQHHLFRVVVFVLLSVGKVSVDVLIYCSPAQSAATRGSILMPRPMGNLFGES